MPTYEYVCSKCGHQFEKFQSIADKSLTICPEDLCARKKWGRGKVKRLIGAGAGLLFKGSGFYITDYRSESYKQAAKKESGTTTPTKGESKSSSSETGGKTASAKPAAKDAGKAKAAAN